MPQQRRNLADYSRPVCYLDKQFDFGYQTLFAAKDRFASCCASRYFIIAANLVIKHILKFSHFGYIRR